MLVVEGIVIGGNQLGRKLGFPTANIAIDDALDIENGVYCSKVFVGDKEYSAMTNVGVRPSVDGSKRLLETHLFGFKGLLYGLTLSCIKVGYPLCIISNKCFLASGSSPSRTPQATFSFSPSV